MRLEGRLSDRGVPNPQSRNGLLFYDSPLLGSVEGLFHAVTTRIGGASEGPRRYLNLSHRLPTDLDAVAANRSRVCEAFGIPPGRTVFPDQVHGDRVARVGEAEAGAGYAFPDPGIPATDGLLTDRPRLYLFALSADCPIVALADPRHRGIALVHSGRRGTARDIVGRAVQAMAREFRSRPGDLFASIGPGIGPCCYEIGPQVADEIRRVFPAAEAFLPVRESRVHLDLPAAIRFELRRAGVPDEQIEISPLCTSCRTDHFYSHRAEGVRTGRFAAILGWRE
ncbi:MAG: peptidoglycan editing factor PgeF [Planctomycetes bacterium]|nr:peptidoglycan editing factor PgeF [Planctomycetota bacterium]